MSGYKRTGAMHKVLQRARLSKAYNFIINTLVSAVILVVAALVAEGSAAEKVFLARVGSKTFYTIEGQEAKFAKFADAVRMCNEADLTLARVDNQAESDALRAHAAKPRENPFHNKVWIGAVYENNKWTWESNGQELSYQNFKPNVRLHSKPDDRIQTNFCGIIGVDSQWDTKKCELGYAIPVCQDNNSINVTD